MICTYYNAETGERRKPYIVWLLGPPNISMYFGFRTIPRLFSEGKKSSNLGLIKYKKCCFSAQIGAAAATGTTMENVQPAELIAGQGQGYTGFYMSYWQNKC